ncbi:MAG: 50S ribosomal protein L31 [Gammaproteobacteria bacterium]|nr:50S ribosomal protein L31 [Gammaproteobacteria bacterium]
MRSDIHPKYVALKVTCSCGNAFETQSTYTKGSLHIEACDKCHTAYTKEKNKGPATGDRVDKFNSRFKRGFKSKEAA